MAEHKINDAERLAILQRGFSEAITSASSDVVHSATQGVTDQTSNEEVLARTQIAVEDALKNIQRKKTLKEKKTKKRI